MKLINDIDNLNKKNDFLLKSNEALKNEINKINQSSLLDKEKIKQLEIENKKLIYENNELNEKLLKFKHNQKEEQNPNKLLEKNNENTIKGWKIKIDNLLFENEHLKSKINLINQEKQKLGLDLQKSELDNKKLILTIDRVKNENTLFLPIKHLKKGLC